MSAAAFLALVGGLVSCSDEEPSGEAREREQMLVNDPIADLALPEGTMSEASTPGSPGEFADFDPPTVNRVYTFTGELRDAAASIQSQLREDGWSVSASCSPATSQEEEFYFVRGRKQFDGFTADFEAHVRSATSDDHPEADVRLQAPYPGESSQRFDDHPDEPTCLD